MMKQWQLTRAGTPRDVLEIAEVPIPTTCKDDELLVRLSHISLNPSFAFKLMPHYSMVNPIRARIGTPAIPEVDFSAVVCELRGSKAQHFKPGDRVFGMRPPLFLDFTHGVLREYALVRYDYIEHIPKNISLRDACCFSASGIVVHHACVEALKLKAGDRVFINGGAGGVGVHAIQLAKKLVGPSGLVIATCSTSKIEKVKQLGADEVVDYTKYPNMSAYLKEKYSSEPFDHIIDNVGNDFSLYTNSPAYLASEGYFFQVGLEFGDTKLQGVKIALQVLSAIALPTYLGGVPRKFNFESTQMKRSRIEGVAQYMKEGTLTAVIDSVYKFDNVLEAYDKVLSRNYVGRVVVEVADLG